MTSEACRFSHGSPLYQRTPSCVVLGPILSAPLISRVYSEITSHMEVLCQAKFTDVSDGTEMMDGIKRMWLIHQNLCSTGELRENHSVTLLSLV